MQFSVLMSVYEKEKPDFLKSAIDSILNQSIKPDEIVIVKDGKLTKELDNIINSYDEQNPNKSIKKGEPVNVILLVVGIGLVILFSAPVVILLRNTSKKLKNDFDYKNSY